MTKRKVKSAAAAVVALGLVAALAGCSDGSMNSGASASGKDSVTYALMPEQGPNWLPPISPADKMITANSGIHQLMWPTLFTYDGADGRMELDKKASVMDSYTFSNDNKTLDIKLKDLDWSDGKPVTSRDVEFTYNLIKANTDKWGSYAEGKFPDNVTAFQIKDDKNFTLTFDQTYNQDYLLANQLTMVTPMPQHAWDKSSADGAVSDLDKTTDGAKAVWSFIDQQGADINSYNTNQMWKVISGPYGVSNWSADGSVTLVANDKYTGPDKPSIKTVNFKPYTSNDAEMNDLRSGAIDYGYITPSQLETKDQYTSAGYKVVPWDGWSITYMPYNFKNPEMGAVFNQLYVRQGLQSAIDQVTISDKIWRGAAEPGYGPVPQNPDSDYLSSVQKNNPYPFDTAKAEKFFTDNGWVKGADGVLSCQSAGTAAGQCGAGVAAGTRMAFTVMTQNGSQETDNMMAALKESFSQIGAEMTIQSATLESVLTEAQKCKSGSDCSWQLVFFGTAGSWYFSAYPTGDRLFADNVKWNAGQYYDPKAFQLIDATLTSTDNQAEQDYSAYLAQQLPVMWLPNPVYQVSVVRNGLNIATQDPSGWFFPQRWSWGN